MALKWLTVVYALLAKPPTNDPDIVGERREIALMEQLMKVVLRAARSLTYERMEGRVLAPQLGWLQGCATAHVGVQLQTLMQQAARVGHTLYVCYVDLATFFPSIDRGVLLEHELLAGVPRDVLNLAAAIFGAAEAEAGEPLPSTQARAPGVAMSRRGTVGTSNKKPACRQVPHGNFLSPDGPGDLQAPWDTSGSPKIDDKCALGFLIARFLIVGAYCSHSLSLIHI